MRRVTIPQVAILIVLARVSVQQTTGQAICVDNINNCVAYGPDICNGTYHEWANQNCNNYCGFCLSIIAVPTVPTKGPLAPTPGTCVNKLQNCDQYGKSACIGAYITWARQNCADFCGFCGTKQTALTSNQTCLYKGQLYRQGQIWHDGCKLNCRCLDASKGFYQCTERCPNITNIPSGCTVFKPNGECCPKLRCKDLSQALQVLGLTSNSTTHSSSGGACVYKGTSYHAGQSWEDHCKLRCNCVDEQLGFYKCLPWCVTWDLPQECHLEAPAQGKCCAVPRCPPGYVINYPDNYIKE